MTRARQATRVLLWLFPIAFCILLYWRGMRIWFQQDDFAWLGLRNHVTDFRSFLWAMFAPLAQGTIRPLSERGFFMLFSYFFGLRALPYRLFVFLNQFVNIFLLMLVTRKLTKSELAALIAPLLWIANAAVVTPMAWTSAYNEIQCATFLLLSFYFFLCYTETGERKFYWAQWTTFVLGFGALELNVVYPAIAALYAILFARRYFRSTLPMFAVSAAYTVVHRLVRPPQKNYYYDLDFHVRSLFHMVARYWNLLVGSSQYADSANWHRAGGVVLLLITAALIGFAAWQTYKRRFLPLFFVCWFFILMGPLLPLRHHLTDYYLFTGTLGIAMLGASAISAAWRQHWVVAIAAAALTLLYLVPATITSHLGIVAYFDRADRARAIVQSVAYAKHIHPGKTILLRGIDDDLFWAAIYDSPFRIFGWNDVFATPDCRAQVHDDPNLGDIRRYFLPTKAVARVLRDGNAVVYMVEDRHLRNVTTAYTLFIESEPQPELASRIDAGEPYFQDQLGTGWYGLEPGFRWATRHAVVYLLGPDAAGEKLLVHGYTPEQQLKGGPLHFALAIDGHAEPVKTIDRSNAEFHFAYDLPPDLIGKQKVEVAFTIDRTFHMPDDKRDLGLTFGEFDIR